MTGPLVDSHWLVEHLDEVVVADVRWSPNGGSVVTERAFSEGHIPGAVSFDLDRDLAGEPFVAGPGRHPLPSPERFAAVLGAAGIRDGDLVVAYDDVRGSVAARLWWMLDTTGRRASLLDGGLEAWTGPLEVGAARGRRRTAPAVRRWAAERLASAEDVERAGHVLLDARTGERFRGETEPIDPVAGHIPGARSAPWAANLDEGGIFRAPDELRARYGSLGVEDGADAVVYCGSGVTSCLDVVAIRLAGLGDARLYVGSWSGWIHDPDRPVATGAG